MKRERLLTAVLLVIAAAALSGQTTEPHIWSLDLLRLALSTATFGPGVSYTVATCHNETALAAGTTLAES